MLMALGGDAKAERERRQLAPANQESLEEPRAQVGRQAHRATETVKKRKVPVKNPEVQ
jgi:hypothetical protein